MSKIIGESFKPWIREQIKTRQSKLSNNDRNDDVLRYITNKGTFIRLSSGVNIGGDNSLANTFPLFGGDLLFPQNNTTPYNQRELIDTPTSYWSDAKQGRVPPPGIVSAEIRPLEMGQIREANIQIICHNLTQFEIIEQLYLRLKYSIFLEWGHTTYFDNKGKFIKNAPVQNFLFKQFISNSNNHLDFLKTIENKRKESNGNYDAFLGFVTNFDWTLRTDGGYDISLRAYSLGDVIESLKINTNFPIPDKNWNANSDQTNDFTTLGRDRSTLHYILYKLKKEIDIQSGGANIFALNGFNSGGKASLHTGEIKRITGLEINHINPEEKYDQENNILASQEFTVGYYPNLSNSLNKKQYFIKLGALLRIINNFLLLYNTSNKNSPVISLDYDYDKNLCFTLPRQSSVDPRVCILDLPEFADTTIVSNPYDDVYKITYQYSTFIDTGTAASSFPNGGSFGGRFEWTSDLDNDLSSIDTIRVTKSDLDKLGYTVGANTYKIDDQTFKNQFKQLKNSKIVSYSAIPETDKSNIIPGIDVDLSVLGFHNETYPKATYYISIDNVIVTNPSVAPAVFQNSQNQYASYFCSPTPPYNNLNLYRKFRVKDNEYLGKHMHILVNVQCIIDIIDSLSEDDTQSTVSLYDFLDTMMSKIQSALGNINNFKVVYDETTNVFNIVDMNFLPGGLKQLNLENNVARFHLNTLSKTEGSFITNFTLKTEIVNELAANITVGAQGQGNQVGFNATAFSKWNYNLTDRILKEKANKNTPNYNETAPTPKVNPFDTYKTNLSDYYYLMYKISTGEVYDSDIESYKGLLADILNYETGYHTNNEDIPGVGFIPLNLQLEMDGLSGMRIYETYNIEESLLPKSYKDNLEFITTTLTHKIDSKGWLTTINGLGSPKYTSTPKYNPPKVELSANGCPPATLPQNSSIPFNPFGQPNTDNAESVFYYAQKINWAPIQLDPPKQLRVTSRPQPNRTVLGRTGPHYGIDFGNKSTGSPIVAPEDGIYMPSAIKNYGGFGPYGVVLLGKSGLYHVMGHNSARSKTLKDGDFVKAGTIIAYVGNLPAGSGTGPHLHWEIRKSIVVKSLEDRYSPIYFANTNPAPPNVYTNMSVPIT